MMGCDIHFVVEKKVVNKWIGVASTDYGYDPSSKTRNYRFFAELAEVRGDSKRERMPLGIPHDISHLSKMCVDSWSSDGHSHSFTTLRDFCEIWYETAYKPDKEREKYKIYDCLELNRVGDIEGDENPDLFRVVFWFDN